MSKVDYTKIKKSEPDWLDQQCTKIYDALDGLSLEQRIGIIEQVLDYLRMEEADSLFVKCFAIKADETNDNGDHFQKDELQKAYGNFHQADNMYYDEHKCCPVCGKDPFETTTLGSLDGIDRNPVSCGCGWSGVVHNLVPKKEIEDDN